MICLQSIFFYYSITKNHKKEEVKDIDRLVVGESDSTCSMELINGKLIKWRGMAAAAFCTSNQVVRDCLTAAPYVGFVSNNIHVKLFGWLMLKNDLFLSLQMMAVKASYPKTNC